MSAIRTVTRIADQDDSVAGKVPVALGGTGSATAAGARTNLGIAIGTDVLAPGGNGSGLTGITEGQIAGLLTDLATLASSIAAKLSPNGNGSALTGLTQSQVSGLTAALAALQPAGNYLTAVTGDVTASGPGSGAATLANTAVTPGSYTSTNLTVDSKGRITSAANGSGGGGGTPGGSTGAVQYNNAGAFGGFGSWDGTTFIPPKISCPGVGAGSERFGDSALAGGAGGVSLGKGASASGMSSLALGQDAVVAGTNAIGLGQGAIASNTGSFALGSSSNVSGIYAAAIGVSTNASHAYSTVIGGGASSSATHQITLSAGVTQDYSAAPKVLLLGTSGTAATRSLGGIDTSWVDDADLTRKSRISLSAYDSGGVREGLRIEGSGTQALLGFYGVNAVPKAAAPTLLADVITILRNLGLCS
jgi:hypothetical protein